LINTDFLSFFLSLFTAIRILGCARRQIQEIVSELSSKKNTKYEQAMKFYLVQIGHIKGIDIVGLKQEFDVFVEMGADDKSVAEDRSTPAYTNEAKAWDC